MLRIKVEEIPNSVGDDAITVVFTNNGNPPESEIVEKGGLATLRSMVEAAGGTMEIGTENGFELRISLSKETEDGI